MRTLLHETSYSKEQVEALATKAYAPGDMGAAIASGSFKTDGMIVAPLQRQDARGHRARLRRQPHSPRGRRVLKERRRLVLAVREAPLSEIHLENMLRLSRMGAVVMPPMPAFYMKPRTLDEIVDHTVARMLDQFGIDAPGPPRWTGDMGNRRTRGTRLPASGSR